MPNPAQILAWEQVYHHHGFEGLQDTRNGSSRTSGYIPRELPLRTDPIRAASVQAEREEAAQVERQVLADRKGQGGGRSGVHQAGRFQQLFGIHRLELLKLPESP